MDEAPSLYDRFGGEGTIRAVVDDFYVWTVQVELSHLDCTNRISARSCPCLSRTAMAPMMDRMQKLRPSASPL